MQKVKESLEAHPDCKCCVFVYGESFWFLSSCLRQEDSLKMEGGNLEIKAGVLQTETGKDLFLQQRQNEAE